VAVLAARPVAVVSPAAPGCPITFPPKATAAAADAPTWSGRVAAILHARCVACHQPDQGAPFALLAFEDARSRLATIRSAVAEDRMPPWHAAGEPGHWANDRRLLADEKRDLLAWIDAGAPSGDLGRAPRPPAATPKDHWEIGTPDAVLAFAEGQEIPAEGVVPYRYVQVATDFPEDRWISAVEVRPGAPDVVHHVLVAAVSPGTRARSGVFNPTAGFFAAVVPGARTATYPDGMAKRLPKGTTLLFQMHYTPNGVAQTDVTRIAFRFLKEAPTKEVFTSGAFNPTFEIPPGAAKHPVRAGLPVPFDVRVLSFMPHMHVRGTSFRYAVRTPDGTETTICDVPRYDFNWQTPYRLAVPRAVPRGSFLLCYATFDNSAENPYNPDPSATVRWGDQTWEEMMIGYVDYVRDE
jgi:mono/diheme cytochrome c family protein